jgi:hypothetical protein
LKKYKSWLQLKSSLYWILYNHYFEALFSLSRIALIFSLCFFLIYFIKLWHWDWFRNAFNTFITQLIKILFEALVYCYHWEYNRKYLILRDFVEYKRKEQIICTNSANISFKALNQKFSHLISWMLHILELFYSFIRNQRWLIEKWPKLSISY